MVTFSMASRAGDQNRPHLRKQGNATQLIVDGKPFLILGGELGNSSASDLKTMQPIWPKLVKMHLNTVLVPVYWELIEPEEGVFDFALVDSIIHSARENKLRLVLLWFGSWKNSMSCYAPAWVKTDQERFPRSEDKDGRGMEILSVFSEENCTTDANAFGTLMRHIREVDDQDHTVIMIQVENEIGMIPEARDRSAAADDLYRRAVPEALMEYLQKHRTSLIPEFRQVWQKAGFKLSGTWEDVFGKGAGTEEIFMAWYFARYVNRIAEAGKAEYPLPMFANAALIRPGYKPGQYPSAGPLPHLMDVWRAGGPMIDFYSPDIYFPNFAEWCGKYHRSGNPLFIPEARGDADAAANVFYAMGQHDGLGFSPFSIESTNDPQNDPITQSYDILSQLAPLILDNQGKALMAGVLVDEENQTQKITLGNYVLNVSHDYTSKWTYRSSDSDQWPRRGCMIISMGPDEYVIAGKGVIVTFSPNTAGDTIAGIARIDEGSFVDGQWIAGRRMNGDQSHQGRHLQLPNHKFDIQRVKLYQYK